MPFASYATIGDVARAHQITWRNEEFVVPLDRQPSEPLRQQLDFTQKFVAYDVSDRAICESLIHPVFLDVWKSYTEELMLWSHVPLNYDDDLSGIPDYLIAPKSALGRWVPELPHIVVSQAKRDDFASGWAQCVAAMLAAQKLNKIPELTLYGMVTNGQMWDFGKLQRANFTKDMRSFTLMHLEELRGAISFVLEQCRSQLLRLQRSA